MLCPVKRRNGFTLIELLVVITIIGVLLAILLPAVQESRETSRRATCQSNLKQLALAVHSFHSAQGYLPTSVREPSVRVSTITQLLPYLEQATDYNKYNPTKNWFDNTGYASQTGNLWVTSKVLPSASCPSAGHSDRTDGTPDVQPWYTTNIDTGVSASGGTGTSTGGGTGGTGGTSDDTFIGVATTDYGATIGVAPALASLKDANGNAYVSAAGVGILTGTR